MDRHTGRWPAAQQPAGRQAGRRAGRQSVFAATHTLGDSQAGGEQVGRQAGGLTVARLPCGQLDFDISADRQAHHPEDCREIIWHETPMPGH